MHPTVGFSMIVKNDASTLRACLESVRGIATELIVGDTGSTDGSQEIARECGARVVSIPWNDDFAGARNAVLAHSTTDWILTLDADEEADEDAKRLLPRLLTKTKIGGYAVLVRNYLPLRHGNVNGNRARQNDGRSKRNQDAPSYAEHLVVRLFRRHPQIRYTGCVHEVIAPQILAAGFKLGQANFCVHHSGYMSGAERYGQKAEFYLGLLRKKVEQEPRNPQAWLELARQLYEPFRRNEEALSCVRRALELAPGLPSAWFLAGVVNLEMGRDTEALAALEKSGGEGEHAAEREHYRGDALHNLGMFREAEAAYQTCLALSGHDPQVESKLGYVEVRLGKCDSGFARMENVLAGLPRGAELHERLIRAYLAAGQLPQAAAAAERFADAVPHPKNFLRAAAIRAHMKEDVRAGDLIARGLKAFPQSAELREAGTQLAVQLQDRAAAQAGR